MQANGRSPRRPSEATRTGAQIAWTRDRLPAVGLGIALGAIAAVALLYPHPPWRRARRSNGLVAPRLAIAALARIGDVQTRHDTELDAALRERTALLDEVHHQVKNNLQVITSLLSLQARSAPPEAREALAECRNRVHAMALTHQLMHENGDLAKLNVGEYLKRLVRLLSDSHRAFAPSIELRIVGADTPLRLPLPRAIPFGLLVTELISDAYRRDYPEGRPGKIEVGLALDGARACLWVADDSVPAAPAGAACAPSPSLGAQLVPLLLEQLGGTSHRPPGDGSRVEIRFPSDSAAPR
jgi:two-component sensor histidine kinase